jgi:antitoxin (DNA-binding transcriptional repressor) of toxin-antitoxin stability system
MDCSVLGLSCCSSGQLIYRHQVPFLTSQFDQSKWKVMREVRASGAKTHLPRLLDDVECGETVIITHPGRAIARLTLAEYCPPGTKGTDTDAVRPRRLHPRLPLPNAFGCVADIGGHSLSREGGEGRGGGAANTTTPSLPSPVSRERELTVCRHFTRPAGALMNRQEEPHQHEQARTLHRHRRL